MFALLASASLLAACSMQSGHSTSPVLPQPDTGPVSHVRPLDTIGGGSLLRGTLKVLLGDSAPQLGGRTLQHLYLGISRIDVTSGGQVTTVESYDQPKVVDVLQFQKDAAQQIGNSKVAKQKFDSLTLVVDIASSQAVFSDHTQMPLTFVTNTPTQSTAGAGVTTATVPDGANAVDIVATQSFTVPEGQTQEIRADFNAFESLALQSQGLITNPVVFVAERPKSSFIEGTVVNANGAPVANATVVATDETGAVRNTDITDDKGKFTLSTLNRGSYSLTIYNAYTNAAGQQYQASGQTSSNATVAGPSLNLKDGRTKNVTITD
jgi:hypothetical protein